MDRDIAAAGADKLQQRLLLGLGVLELGIAAVGVGDDQRVLADGRRLEDGRILAQGYLETSRVLQQLGKVECLIAVTVVLPLATGKKVDLDPAG